VLTYLIAAAHTLQAEGAVQGDVLSVWQAFHGRPTAPLISAHLAARFDGYFSLNLLINNRLCHRYSRYRRDFAIVMLFLQTGLRVSELVNLRLGDVSLETKELTVRQGKGRKDRVVPLVGQALEALKAYLKVRTPSLEYNHVFLARNATSMDQRTVRYRIQKYYEEAKPAQMILYASGALSRSDFHL
jgi:site-specific recombinase XerC